MEAKFDALLHRLHQRLLDHQRNNTAGAIFAQSATADAEALWTAAQPTDSADEDASRRLLNACYALGWLHFFRSVARGELDLLELARALVYLRPLAHDVSAIPAALSPLIGPDADPHSQIAMAAELLRQAFRSPQPALLNAGNMLNIVAAASPVLEPPDRAECLTNLATGLQLLYRRAGTAADLDRAVDVGEQAVTLMPSASPERPVVLSNLAETYEIRFTVRGNGADLDRAIELGEEAWQTIPEGNADRPRILSNVASAYRHRFREHLLETDLDRAIELAQLAVDSTSDQHSDKPMFWSNLAFVYHAAYDATGATKYLDHEISLTEAALVATAKGHADRATYLYNLGRSYIRRFQQSDRAEDLDRAIEHLEEMLSIALVGSPDWIDVVAALMDCTLSRFFLHHDESDLDRAIHLGSTVAEDLHQAGAETSTVPIGLAWAYLARHRVRDERADLVRSIEILEAHISNSHRVRADALAGLAHAHRTRLRQYSEAPDRKAIADLVQHLHGVAGATPAELIGAYREVGLLANAMHEPGIALSHMRAAVELLPSLVGHEATFADQERRLGTHNGLMSEAIAVHCELGDPEAAIEVAEVGRGVIIAARMNLRSDITTLEEERPDLATRFRDLRDKLNAPDGSSVSTTAELNSDRARQRQLWTDYHDMLDEIRREPGHSRFLASDPSQVRAATADRCTVLINAGEDSGHAIIVAGDAEPVLVRLPELNSAVVVSNAAALLEVTHDTSSLVNILRRQRVIPALLGWLWQSVVEPILDVLLPLLAAETPRVWWMPTGLISLFPIHAAGRPDERGALDLVISSYTSTLRALAHAQSRTGSPKTRQLTVGLENTPGLSHLPGTVTEAAALHARYPDLPALNDREATVQRVCAVLADATRAHFACHAVADFRSPSAGGLCLYDGILTISEISRLDLQRAELAYLSACSTALGGFSHADEAIHLASAFQLAGFRHVVATLWPIADDLAAAAAQSFYRLLSAEPSEAAMAANLRKVALGLRAEHPNAPHLWAPLIHVGL